MEFVNSFRVAEKVTHIKSGGVYQIMITPSDDMLIEENQKPFYMYSGDNGIIWVRPKDEMEDGRFKLTTALRA